MKEHPGALTGIEADIETIRRALKELESIAGDPEKSRDGSRVYDFSIRWGTLMSGRLLRLEHYYQAGELTEDQELRYRELRGELSRAMPAIEKLGLTEPHIHFED